MVSIDFIFFGLTGARSLCSGAEHRVRRRASHARASVHHHLFRERPAGWWSWPPSITIRQTALLDWGWLLLGHSSLFLLEPEADRLTCDHPRDGFRYMEWVKTLPHVAFNLANSGVKNYPLSGLPVDFDSLTLSGPGAYGYAPLVQAIAAKCGVEPDCVATAQGTSMANLLAMAVTIEPGDEVLIEHPAYPLLWETAQYLGAALKYFERAPAERFAIDVDTLQRSITPRTRLIVLTNLHNPSCAYTDQATLRRVGEIAASAGARVLIDEVYLDLLFESAPQTAFHLGPEFIVTNSLTKCMGSAASAVGGSWPFRIWFERCIGSTISFT